jgi:HEAT repeat protein
MTALSAFVLLLVPQADAAGDPAKALGSNDPEVRLAAVRTIAEQGHADAEKLLLKALRDDDWEIATIAATELGELGAAKALEPLLELALEAPVRGLRVAAAQALAGVDAATAYEKLAKRASGKTAVRACEAIAELAPALADGVKTKELEKLLGEREIDARRAAARALVRMDGAARPERLATFLDDSDVALRAAAIEAAAASGDARTFEILARRYETPALADFLARRIDAALRALLLAAAGDQEELLGHLDAVARTAHARGHVARVTGVLGAERDGTRALAPEVALARLVPFLADATPAVRATAVAACARIGGDAALDAAAALHEDPDARVRRIVLGVAARTRGARHDGTRARMLARRGADPGARVRESAAANLGGRGVADVVTPLAEALADPDWRVVTSAAVALGKTEDEGGVAALEALYAGGGDWKSRASAVAGLPRMRSRAAVPLLIRALTDDEALVARTAHEFLCEIARERLEPKPAVWTKWWEANGPQVKLSLPEAVIEARKKLEYVRTAEELFAGTFVGVDVLVLQSQGDHVENVLTGLEIEHRRTSSGQLLSDGLHPFGVFVSNCTGEVTPAEIERLSWFVRAGGALFGSCWALRETIEPLEAGLVRKLETRGEVLGDVAAYPVDTESPYLEGVFDGGTRPIYYLEGAHLIEVLDPEEVEVLVDSPECAAKFGGANLAAWFRLGHGVVLDSANHFEGQGFLTANVNDPEARKAYAIDHLGLTYAKLREQRDAKFWGRKSGTAENVKDFSVFRLLTNFVWLKRLAEE